MFRHINSFKSKHEQNPAYIMRQLLIALYYAKQKSSIQVLMKIEQARKERVLK